jgi:tetratricopeptide (TPR) repeat protein
MSRGDASKNQSEYDQAIAEYSAALRTNPNNVFAYIKRGGAYGMKGDADRAIADFTQALKINPNDTFARELS